MASDRPVASVAAPIRGIGAGAVVAFSQVATAVALADLVFPQELGPAIYLGTALFLIAAILPGILLAVNRDLPAPLFVAVQNAPIAILLPALAAVELSDRSFPTMLAILGGTAVATALFMGAIALFDLGRLIRVLPYPVSAGFLASTGALLIVSSTQSISPVEISGLAAEFARGNDTLLAPLLALGFGGGLWLASKAAPNLGVIGLLVVVLCATQIVIAATGMTEATAQALGLRPQIAPADQGIHVAPVAWGVVDWAAVGAALPLIATAVLVGTIACLLNVTGIELILGEDIDTSSVLTRTAAANVVNGIVGAPPSYPSASSTSIGFSLGGPGTSAVFTVAVILGLAAFSVPQFIAYLPPFMLAGMLIFVGAELLNRWFFSLRRSLSLSDWVLTGSFIVVALTFGMIAAVQLGLVVACLAFAISYGRLRVVRSSADLRSRRSRVDRGPVQTDFLDTHGEEVAVVALQGYLFFGSVEQVTEHVRALLDRPLPARRVILDFSRVRQIDAAAIAAMQKLHRLVERRGVMIVLTEMPPAVAEAIGRAGLVGAGTEFCTIPRLDDALEDAEAHLLQRIDRDATAEDALSALGHMTGAPDIARRLMDCMERRSIAAGELLIRKGDRTTDIYFVDSGRLAIQLPGADGSRLRVRSISAGALVGEMASYMHQARGADVIAETDGVVYRLSVEAVDALSESDPDLVVAFHRMMASALAEKLHRTNELLSEVL